MTGRFKEIYDEAEKSGVRFQSIAYGEIEAWNYILCQFQNAGMENDSDNALAYLESALCYESDEVVVYFKARGIMG